jgi:hypothetical protein
MALGFEDGTEEVKILVTATTLQTKSCTWEKMMVDINYQTTCMSWLIWVC